MKKQIKFLLVLLLLQCLTITTLFAQSGLIAWYPFNGNAQDATGNGYNGTVSGAILTNDRFGNAASAYSFDGINDAITIGTEPNFPSWASYAVSVWFLNNGGGDQGQGYGQKILSKAQGGTDFHLGVLNDGSQGRLSWWSAQGGFNAVDATNQDYRDNKWHHVILNKHSPGNGDIWVDGILQNSSTGLQAVFNSENLVIGFTTHSDGFQQKHWSGKIDDIRIYNRVLSTSEIATLFTEGGWPFSFFLDADGDGFGDAGNRIQTDVQPAGYVADSTDCNDASAAINPSVAEILGDSIDNNCNGIIDEVTISNNLGNQSWQDPAFWQSAGLNGIPDSTSVINISGTASGNLTISGNAEMKSLIIDSASSLVVSFGTDTITIKDGELNAPKAGSINAEEASLVLKGNTKLNTKDRVKSLTIDERQAAGAAKLSLQQDAKVKGSLAVKAPALELTGGKQIEVEKNMVSSAEITGDGKIAFTGSDSSTITAPPDKSQGSLKISKADAAAKVRPTAPMKAKDVAIESGKLDLANQQVTAPVAIKGGDLTGTGIIKGTVISKKTAGVNMVRRPAIRTGKSPGLITIEGDLDMDSTDLGFELFGTEPGTGYDQIKVTGTVKIGNDVLLELTADSIPHFEFVIIDNDDTDPVDGRFSGLPNNGDTISSSGNLFRINYNGGDGNDISLTMNDPVPVISACPPDTTVCLANNTVEYAIFSNTIPTPLLTYSFSGATTVDTGTPGTGSGSSFNVGITNVVVAATNEYGYATCSFTVEVTNNSWYADADGDGYGDPAINIQDCTQPTGYVADNSDCDDNDITVYPGAPEICDSKDNDCNGTIDDGLPVTTYYADADSDGYGDANNSIENCSQPAGYILDNSDCNDNDATVNPGATEICDGIDNDCDGMIDEELPLTTYYRDYDRDGYGNLLAVIIISCSQPAGYVTNSLDCNDQDNTIYPGAPELCDGKDNNCDGRIDEGIYFADRDRDGYGDPASGSCVPQAGYVSNDDDCNDMNRDVHPGMPEICDGTDNDCNGVTDDGFPLNTYYLDADGDGYGDINKPVQNCTQPTGYAVNSGDCNIFDNTVYPGAPEICDSKDNDCNGVTDDGFTLNTYYLDADNDGYGDISNSIESCSQQAGYVLNNTDCNDNDATIYPNAPELCDGKDNDCNGQVDEGITYYKDVDADGYGNITKPKISCSQPAGYVNNSLDCKDNDATIHPGAPEVCDGKDNDCNGAIDDGVTITYYRDADGDGYGNISRTRAACTQPAGYVSNSTDCNDNNSNINPGKTEICGNNIDDNCNGEVNEGCPLITVTAQPASAAEGNSGKIDMVFTIGLSAPATTASSVDFQTVAVTATAGTDYITKTGTVNFATGQISKTVVVKIFGDQTPEPDETFNLVLSNPVNIAIYQNTATGTIINDDGFALMNNQTDIKQQTLQKAAVNNKLVVPTLLHKHELWRIPALPPSNSVILVDGNGKTILKTTNYKNDKNFGNYSPGLYYYRIMILVKNGKHEIYQGKLMIVP